MYTYGPEAGAVAEGLQGCLQKGFRSPFKEFGVDRKQV